MESMIAKLLDDFERGKMSRRQLIKSLGAVAAVAAGAASLAGATSLANTTSSPIAAPESAAAPREQSKGFRAVAVNHISYQVNDYAKTRDFYADLLGLKVVADTGTQCDLVLGDSNTFIIPRNARAGAAVPRIDHIAYTIENWDANAVKAELERRGLTPRVDTENSFHVTDPNGYDLQISGKDMKPV
jgi:catechol 2,3-dioxygenase-like lactoylglutathione lyase family enzyme